MLYVFRLSIARENMQLVLDKVAECRSLFGDSDSTNEGIKQFFSKDQGECGVLLFFRLLCHVAHSFKTAEADIEAFRLEDERKVHHFHVATLLAWQTWGFAGLHLFTINKFDHSNCLLCLTLCIIPSWLLLNLTNNVTHNVCRKRKGS